MSISLFVYVYKNISIGIDSATCIFVIYFISHVIYWIWGAKKAAPIFLAWTENELKDRQVYLAGWNQNVNVEICAMHVWTSQYPNIKRWNQIRRNHFCFTWIKRKNMGKDLGEKRHITGCLSSLWFLHSTRLILCLRVWPAQWINRKDYIRV